MDNSPLKILIADDEKDILEILEFKLQKQGFEVYTANHGRDALEIAKKVQPQLFILDVMMPFKTGIEVCELLRKDINFKQTPIILLTALGDETSHIKGLEAGADDYITKPVSTNILVTRIQTLLRRVSGTNATSSLKTLEFDDIKIDPNAFLVVINSQEIILAKKEFELLYLLAGTPGKVFLRNEILNQVWGNEVIVGDRTIDVHVRKIRQKLNLDCIATVKGVGYKFVI
ncbi:MAG: response regulator [Chitinophagaceae bacterium]